MKIHRLKTWPVHFKDVVFGGKKSEVRINDRDFQVGDCLVLQEYDPESNRYTGRGYAKKVTHVLHGHEGIKSDFVVMSIESFNQISGGCAVCKCTDYNCGHCIEKTGHPCSWVNADHTLCSACAFEGTEVNHG